MHTKLFWNAVLKNWESLGVARVARLMAPQSTFYIALEPHSKNALIDGLYEVSGPAPGIESMSPSFLLSRTFSHVPLLRCRYGAHLPKEQVAPHPETLELINSWLGHHGVPSSSVSMTLGGNTLTLKGVSVTQASALLDASYQLYRHVEGPGVRPLSALSAMRFPQRCTGTC